MRSVIVTKGVWDCCSLDNVWKEFLGLSPLRRGGIFLEEPGKGWPGAE